jgi:transposase-like protein
LTLRVSNQEGDHVTEQQLARMARRRLTILRHAEEITGNVSLTCRYYGISRQGFYTWRRRYDAHGLDGLRDRSHRPQVSPNATRTEVVGKIIYLRQHYHFGPARIAMYLRRYHDIQLSPRACGGSSNGCSSTACPPPSATSGTTGAGSAMRNRCPATASSWM